MFCLENFWETRTLAWLPKVSRCIRRNKLHVRQGNSWFPARVKLITDSECTWLFFARVLSDLFDYFSEPKKNMLRPSFIDSAGSLRARIPVGAWIQYPNMPDCKDYVSSEVTVRFIQASRSYEARARTCNLAWFVPFRFLVGPTKPNGYSNVWQEYWPRIPKSRFSPPNIVTSWGNLFHDVNAIGGNH